MGFIIVAFVAALFPYCARSQDFDTCQTHAEQLWNGTDMLGLTPEQVNAYLYRGPVRGMDNLYNRSQFVTLTTEGKTGLEI